jgi:DNA-binding NarL/FixJ family response regulator
MVPSREQSMHENRSVVRVLLVEDQILVQTGLAALIDSADAMQVVATAENLNDAIRAVRDLRPDIVLLGLPREWGVYAAIQDLGEQFPDTKVIVLDDRSVDANVREALRVRAAGYLTKQQPFPQIEASIRRAMRGDRVFTPDIAARLVLSADGVRLDQDTAAGPLSSLTPRETDVLIHLAQGFSVKQCAKALGIGASTAGNHKSRLMKKLQVHKTVDLTRMAIREGLVPETDSHVGHAPAPSL